MIIIGCPVLKREWVLPTWFKAIEEQDYPLEDIGFIFVTAPGDCDTLEVLLDFSNRHPEVACFDIEEINENHRYNEDGRRTWTPSRYTTMVNLRNHLIDRVSCHNPKKFFSLDSDIILEDPTTLSQLDALTDKYDAVAPLMYMTPESTFYPSVMSWHAVETHKAFRAEDYPIGQVFQADIIMAAVMMSRPVYKNVRYQWHKQGEDLGWSREATEQGYKLYSASHLYCPHLMTATQLETYHLIGDPRTPQKITT